MTTSIAIDVMGGARGVETNVEAVGQLDRVDDLILVGDRGLIESHEATAQLLDRGAAIHHASDWLRGDESLNEVLRHRTDASMAVCARLVLDGTAAGMVSSGDTRALMALSRRYLGMMAGLQRPAITKAFTGDTGMFWMLDLGANVDCSPRVLMQFAALGRTIAALTAPLPDSDDERLPRVALLNIGTEQGKGSKTLNDAARLIDEELAGMDFVGFLEPNELFDGKADIVVCDGFVGNLLLKTLEGAATYLGRSIQRGLLGGSWLSKLGISLARSDIEAIRDELNPQNYNGALLAGVRDGIVVKSHGSAGALGFQAAIRQTRAYVDSDLIAKLEQALGAS